MRIASIDIGTNTARCLVSEVQDGILTPLTIDRDIIRLGEGLRARGGLDPDALGRLTAVLERYSRRIGVSGCSRVRAVGTSALRDGGRSLAVRQELQNVLGYPVDIISTAEEARLTCLGVQAGVGAISEGMVMDIGGGSTELVRVSGGSNTWWSSLPIGVIHLTEEFFHDDPPTGAQVEAFRTRVRGLLDLEGENGGVDLAGTAGTPTTLAAIELGIDDYDPTLVNGHVLPRGTIQDLVRRFLEMTSGQRLGMKGMEKGREDLIVAGSLVVLEVMDRWNFRELIVSDWGLLEGIALDAAEKNGS